MLAVTPSVIDLMDDDLVEEVQEVEASAADNSQALAISEAAASSAFMI